MAKEKDSLVPKEVEKEVPKESLKQLEVLYKLMDVLDDTADIKSLSLHHITDDGNREQFKVFSQKVLELKHQLGIFLPNFVKELKATSAKGIHTSRFSSKKVIEHYLSRTT